VDSTILPARIVNLILTLHDLSKRLALMSVPVAVGATVTGVTIVALAVLYCRNHRRQLPYTEADPEPVESSIQPRISSTFSTCPPLHPDASHDRPPFSLLPEDTNLRTSDISPDPTSPISTISFATHVPTSSIAATGTS
jgi:hypothetical protein